MHQSSVSSFYISQKNSFGQVIKPLPSSNNSQRKLYFRIQKKQQTALLNMPKYQGSSKAIWSIKQREKYMIFVCYHQQDFKRLSELDDYWYLFKALSKYIQTRNPNQCRINHLSNMKQFLSLENLINSAILKVPNLKLKLKRQEQRLIQVLLQFKIHKFKLQLNRGLNTGILKHTEIVEEEGQQQSQQDLKEKEQKQDNIKTSDTYFNQEKPVNNKKNQFSYNKHQSNIPLFSKPKSRSSLPSFDQPEAKPKQKSLEPEKNMQSQFNMEKQLVQSAPILKHYSSYKNQKSTQNVQVQSQQQQQQPNKSKSKKDQVMQCFYLMQLWMSKLQKLVRQNNLQAINQFTH